jgi:hypothetical protein
MMNISRTTRNQPVQVHLVFILSRIAGLIFVLSRGWVDDMIVLVSACGNNGCM